MLRTEPSGFSCTVSTGMDCSISGRGPKNTPSALDLTIMRAAWTRYSSQLRASGAGADVDAGASVAGVVGTAEVTGAGE